MCLDIQDGMALVDSLDDVCVMWVLEDGEQVYSEGFSAVRIEP